MKDMTIGKKLYSLRKQKGISMQTLADYLHTSRQTVSKWENDQSIPDLNTLMKICEYYDVNINYFLSNEQNQNDFQDIYFQLQQMLEAQQYHNQRKNIFNFVLIFISIISLCVSLTLGNKLNQFSNNKQEVQSENILADFPINEINEDSEMLLKSNKNKMSMDVNLSDMTANVSYCFILREHTENMKVSIEFQDINNHKFSFNLKREDDNEFILNEKIPVRNYENVFLKVDDGSGYVKTENIGANRNCHYMDFVVRNVIKVYIPLNDENTLDLNKIVYEPTIPVLYGDNQIHGYLKFNGKLLFAVYNALTEQEYLRKNISPNEINKLSLSQSLPLDENVYLYLQFTIKTPDGDYKYTYGSNANHQGIVEPFKVNQQNEPFEVNIYGV